MSEKDGEFILARFLGSIKVQASKSDDGNLWFSPRAQRSPRVEGAILDGEPGVKCMESLRLIRRKRIWGSRFRPVLRARRTKIDPIPRAPQAGRSFGSS